MVIVLLESQRGIQSKAKNRFHGYFNLLISGKDASYEHGRFAPESGET